ncbi:MAG: hypothetical protein ACO1NZ_08845 [Adhaeribacter sp.]
MSKSFADFKTRFSLKIAAKLHNYALICAGFPILPINSRPFAGLPGLAAAGTRRPAQPISPDTYQGKPAACNLIWAAGCSTLYR